MDTELKCAIGMLLGELAILQRHLGIPTYPEHEIFGLLKGIESVIDSRIKKHWIPTDVTIRARDLLLKYAEHPEKPIAGFKDIQDDLMKLGIDQTMATIIFVWFKCTNEVPARILDKLEAGGMDLEIDLDTR